MSSAHGHGTGQHVAEAHGGEIPPVPAQRHITPAPEDYVNLPGAFALVFPLGWCVLAGLLIAALLGAGWGLHHA